MKHLIESYIQRRYEKWKSQISTGELEILYREYLLEKNIIVKEGE
jgi:hypothetical protein